MSDHEDIILAQLPQSPRIVDLEPIEFDRSGKPVLFGLQIRALDGTIVNYHRITSLMLFTIIKKGLKWIDV